MILLHKLFDKAQEAIRGLWCDLVHVDSVTSVDFGGNKWIKCKTCGRLQLVPKKEASS